jgi:hypothetical protein
MHSTTDSQSNHYTSNHYTSNHDEQEFSRGTSNHNAPEFSPFSKKNKISHEPKYDQRQKEEQQKKTMHLSE